MQHRVASDPATAVNHFGLTDAGAEQVRHTIQEQHGLDGSTLIFCSDFKRTRGTARLAADCLKCSNTIQIDIRLRERYFGDYEAGSADIYETVWLADRKNAHQTDQGVESVFSVAQRMTDLVRSVDHDFEGRKLLIVSHGDPLQILECCFREHDIAAHRELEPLNTAELRELTALT